MVRRIGEEVRLKDYKNCMPINKYHDNHFKIMGFGKDTYILEDPVLFTHVPGQWSEDEIEGYPRKIMVGYPPRKGRTVSRLIAESIRPYATPKEVVYTPAPFSLGNFMTSSPLCTTFSEESIKKPSNIMKDVNDAREKIIMERGIKAIDGDINAFLERYFGCYDSFKMLRSFKAGRQLGFSEALGRAVRDLAHMYPGGGGHTGLSSFAGIDMGKEESVTMMDLISRENDMPYGFSYYMELFKGHPYVDKNKKEKKNIMETLMIGHIVKVISEKKWGRLPKNKQKKKLKFLWKKEEGRLVRKDVPFTLEMKKYCSKLMMIVGIDKKTGGFRIASLDKTLEETAPGIWTKDMFTYGVYTPEGRVISEERVIKAITEQVRYCDRATIITDDHHVKVVSKCSNDDIRDPVIGYLYAYHRKHSGLSVSKRNRVFDKLRSDCRVQEMNSKKKSKKGKPPKEKK